MTRLIKDNKGDCRVFDELSYISSNPKIAEELAQGAYTSAEEHYQTKGQYEDALGVPLLDEVFDVCGGAIIGH